MEILERSQAVLQNLKRFYTGRPCRKGHFSERFTSSGQCIECMKKNVGMFVRFSVEAHQDDRSAVEEFARGLMAARGREVGDISSTVMSPDEREYRAIVDRWRKAGAQPYQVPRSHKSFKLPEGEMPW